jgi:hypothetical protein
MTIFKTSLAAGSRYSVAMCTVLACLNVAYADFGKDAIVDNGVDRAFRRANGNDGWARGGPLHLFPSECHRDGGSGTACDANKRTAKSHCVPVPRRSCGENQ